MQMWKYRLKSSMRDNMTKCSMKFPYIDVNYTIAAQNDHEYSQETDDLKDKELLFTFFIFKLIKLMIIFYY